MDIQYTGLRTASMKGTNTYHQTQIVIILIVCYVWSKCPVLIPTNTLDSISTPCTTCTNLAFSNSSMFIIGLGLYTVYHTVTIVIKRQR